MTEYPERRDPKRRPTHPGEILREDVLPSLKMTVKDAAAAMTLGRPIPREATRCEATRSRRRGYIQEIFPSKLAIEIGYG